MLRRILDSPWPYFVGAGVLFVLAVASQFEVRFPSRSAGTVEDIAKLPEREDLNVVFILIDALRADRLGVYGYERPTSPGIDTLAARGVVFRHVFSQSSWTKTSMASLWTATNPQTNGVLRYNHSLPETAVVPAERFREAGFRTVGIWRNGWVAPNFGFGQGFEIYLRPKPGVERMRIERGNPSSHPLAGTDEDIIKSALEFFDNFGNERFLLYMHFMDVHQYVYDEAAAIFGTSYSDAYDQSINWTDRLVSLLFETMDKADLLKKTLVVIASDHGEAFREHGLEGHARNLYREVTQVPLIFVMPFLLEPGIVVETPVSNIDVWPTLLDLAGLLPLPGVDGTSLVPLILEAGGLGAPAHDFPRPIFGHLDRRWGHPRVDSRPLVSVTGQDFRVIMPVDDRDRVELYDRSEDRGDSNNLYGSTPELAQGGRQLLEEYLAGDGNPWGSPPNEVELDEMKLEQLRALGYVLVR